MTHYTVFTTPGELDLSALTTFGMNAKPNTTNPIGFFGTGLKYAIAVLLRHDIPVTIYTGGQEYHFYTKETDFRGKTFKTCRYKAKGLWKGWKYVELPFTTELGKHWELWQAFRELYSNTLDEGGELITSEHFLEDLEVYDHKPKYPGNSKNTWIAVDGQAFADVVAKKDEIFLPKDKLKLVIANSDVEVYEGSSRYIYYRGLRAYDLRDWEKVTMYTYNYIGRNAGLTEDRTIKYLFYVKEAIASLVAKSDDRKFIGTLLKPKGQYFEKDLDYSTVYSKSSTFDSIVRRMGSSGAVSYMPSSARSYYSDVLNALPKTPGTFVVSNAIWEAIEAIHEKLGEQSSDFSDWENAIDAFQYELAALFGRLPPVEVKSSVEGAEMLPPGIYNAQISDVQESIVDGVASITVKAKVVNDVDGDDIPF